MPSPLDENALATLRHAMVGNQNWIGIHAAEVLASFGMARSAHERFLQEASDASTQPHRVGIWRVLASTAPSPEARAPWVALIERTFLDPNAPDRKQAIESLAKLGHPTQGPVLAAVRLMAVTPPVMNTVLPLWSLHYSGDPTALPQLVALLRSEDSIARQRAAYALRWIKPDSDNVRHALTQAAAAEPAGTPRLFILCAALALDADEAQRASWQAEVEAHFYRPAAAGRYEAGMALMSLCETTDLPRLEPLLADADHDTRVAAAAMILQLSRRAAITAK